MRLSTRMTRHLTAGRVVALCLVCEAAHAGAACTGGAVPPVIGL
jgi:hypothetical protein